MERMSPDADRPAEPGTRRRERRPRRRLPALVIIIVVGVIAVAAVFALASALDDDRPHGPYLIGAWTFGDGASLDAAVKAGALDEVSVDWLQSRADGSVVAPRLDTAFIHRAKHEDCRVFATLTDYDETTHTFDRSIPAAILKTAESRRRHAAAVAAWCKTYDVAGVDVDWEALEASDRDAFSAFVEELARRLHDDGRLVAVDVVPKLREPGSWYTPQAQDWARLGRAVDQFRVMTYNYSGSWSGPGPLSPPDWMDRVLSYAESQVPPRRIVMGLGFYGRDWQGSTTKDLVWSDVQSHPRRRPPAGDAHRLPGAVPLVPQGRRAPPGVLPRRRGRPRQGRDASLAPPSPARRLRVGDGPGGPARVARAGARAPPRQERQVNGSGGPA